MSAIAGRVLQIHKGAYDAATAYSPLDEVLYQGSTYVCKQNSTGNLPTNTTYWQLVAQKGADGSNTDPNAVHWSDRKGYVTKNILKNVTGNTTINNVAFTVGADGSVTANGTPSNQADYYYCGGDGVYQQFVKKDGQYAISCTGITTGNHFYVIKSGGTIICNIVSSSDNPVITLEANETYRIFYRVEVATNNTVYPMIRLSTTDSTYEPYLTPNTEIDNKLSYADNTVLGAKNICPNKNIGSSPYTQAGITVTTHDDGSFTTSAGTLSGSNLNGYLLADPYTIKAGTYILSGFPNTNIGGELEIKDKSTDTIIALVNKNVSKAIFTLNSDTTVYIRPWIPNGTTLVESTWHPMIRIASDTDDTYSPYAMTNRELTKICNPAIIKDITTEVRTKLGTTTYTINQAFIFETEQKVDLDIWVVGITSGNIDWDLTGVIPKSRGRKGGIIAPRNDNPAGLTWINNNEAILCNRFATSVDTTKEYLVTISYFKQ